MAWSDRKVVHVITRLHHIKLTVIRQLEKTGTSQFLSYHKDRASIDRENLYPIFIKYYEGSIKWWQEVEFSVSYNRILEVENCRYSLVNIRWGDKDKSPVLAGTVCCLLHSLWNENINSDPHHLTLPQLRQPVHNDRNWAVTTTKLRKSLVLKVHYCYCTPEPRPQLNIY